MKTTIKQYAKRLNNLLSSLINNNRDFEESFIKELYIESIKITIYEFFKPKKYEILRIFNRDGYPWIDVSKDGIKTSYKIIPSINMVNVMPHYFDEDEVDVKEEKDKKVIYVNFYPTYKKAINFENSIKGQAIVGLDKKYYYGEIRVGKIND